MNITIFLSGKKYQGDPMYRHHYYNFFSRSKIESTYLILVVKEEKIEAHFNYSALSQRKMRQLCLRHYTLM